MRSFRSLISTGSERWFSRRGHLTSVNALEFATSTCTASRARKKHKQPAQLALDRADASGDRRCSQPSERDVAAKAVQPSCASRGASGHAKAQPNPTSPAPQPKLRAARSARKAAATSLAAPSEAPLDAPQPASSATSTSVDANTQGTASKAPRVRSARSRPAGVATVDTFRAHVAKEPAGPSGPSNKAQTSGQAVVTTGGVPTATRVLQTLQQTSSESLPKASDRVLLVIDGNYLANRAYFGYGAKQLTTSGGVPTSITYSIVKTLHAAIRSLKPTAVAVVFDPPGPTFRTAISLLDPTGPFGDAARQLVAAGRLNWQTLATRLLRLAQPNLLAAVAAESSATPRAFLSHTGTFLTPPQSPVSSSATFNTAAAAAEVPLTMSGKQLQDVTTPPLAPPFAVSYPSAADASTMLLAALGPELAAELGLAPGVEGPGGVEGSAVSLASFYKAGRTPHDQNFYVDFYNCQRLLGLMSLTPVSRPWLEADDVASLLVQSAVRQGYAVRLVTGDRDLMQLVCDERDVSLLYPARNTAGTSSTWAAGPSTREFPFVQLREAEVMAALGVGPELVVEYKALAGDDSDRLPGVPGIGPKTAAQLLKSYGSLSGVYQAVEAGQLTPKRRASLQAAWTHTQYTLAMARVLGTPGAPEVCSEVLPDGLLHRLQLRGFDSHLVQSAMRELEMHSIARGAMKYGEVWKAFGGGR